ncbi:uncharacterized protein LOC123561868 isoform X2 [Mercenaria mercenaria]|nr:uncharacterized protein LOC123561868 isoform X2 [Mercenaria mercenaria]XP_045210472.2 uncharacterized protein LOC123561868 isoform X2 [Mercenaria mercenaria]
MVCGDANSQWSICQPKTPGVRRILSAHLDIRYENRYCRRYGMPENFGLSASGRSMWTVKWCYGTFFLCLELDSEISDEHPDGDNSFGVAASTSDLYEPDKTTSQLSDKTTSQTTTESITTLDNVLTTEFNYNEHFIVETGPLETDDYITNEEYFEGELLTADNSSSNTSHAEEHIMDNNYDLDPRLKFWLIFAIVGGGIIIVILIAVIAFLTMQCCDSNTDEEKSCDSKPKKSARRKYFRPQKWSTSALMTSEPEYCTDVYDFIPAAQFKHMPSIRREYETPEKQRNKQSDDELSKKATTEVNDDSEIQNGSLSKNNSSKRNDYFILLPHGRDDVSLNSNNISGQANTEDIYDHLVHTPTASMPDSSTYHHLNFKRDLTINEKSANSVDNLNNQTAPTPDTVSDESKHKLIQPVKKSKVNSEDNNYQRDLSRDEKGAKSDYSLDYRRDLSNGEKGAKPADNGKYQRELADDEKGDKSDHNLRHEKCLTHDEKSVKLDQNQNLQKDLTDYEKQC